MIVDAQALSIMVFALWVLLPLAPSVLIYLIFPNTQVAASGPLAGLTIKASGAFAAYLIVLLVSALPVRSIQGLIEGSSNGYWRVNVPVQYRQGVDRGIGKIDDNRVSVSVIPVEYGFTSGTA